MRIGVVLQLFLAASRVQRKRAVLTIASIAWGSVALLLLLAFGEGLKQQLSRGSAGMGTNLAVLWMGETSKPWQGLPPGRAIRPRVDDVDLLRERIPGLVGIVAEMRNWRSAFTYGSKTVNGRLTGSSPEYGELRHFYPEAGGRFIDVMDEVHKRRVVFLGNERAQEIFGEENPVGKTLLINQTPFTVIGVMKRKIQMGTYGGPDAENAVIPLSTYVAMFGSDRVGNIVLKPERPEEMPRVLADLHRILGAKYGFDPSDEKVFPTWDTVKTGSIMRNILVGIQIFLGVIGALTLMIGGVGVANIMYATVKERTREIGVKMALGARPSWIVGPLVLEGLLYTVVGGAIGLLIGMILIVLIGLIPTAGNDALEFLGKPTLSPMIGLATAGILGLVGLLAAYFPARRAASVDPAQTLRYE